MKASWQEPVHQEKRAHRRLTIRIPLEYRKQGVRRSNVSRTMTINVSTGGIYFETTDDTIAEGDLLELELGIPPGDSRFPIQGKIANLGKVVRKRLIETDPDQPAAAYTRYGLAAQFQEEFKIITD